jgi:hypothetical protein
VAQALVGRKIHRSFPAPLPWHQNGFALRVQGTSERHARRHEISDGEFPVKRFKARAKKICETRF